MLSVKLALLHALNVLRFSHAYKTIKYHFPSLLHIFFHFHFASSPQNSIDFSTQLNLSLLIKLINFSELFFPLEQQKKFYNKNENIKNAFNCNQTTLACCVIYAECLKRVSIMLWWTFNHHNIAKRDWDAVHSGERKMKKFIFHINEKLFCLVINWLVFQQEIYETRNETNNFVFVFKWPLKAVKISSRKKILTRHNWKWWKVHLTITLLKLPRYPLVNITWKNYFYASTKMIKRKKIMFSNNCLQHKKCNLIIIIIKGLSFFSLFFAAYAECDVCYCCSKTRALFVGNGKCHNNIA